MEETGEGSARYAVKQVGDRYYPVIVDEEAGGHYEINNPLTGGVLSYKSAEAAEAYIKRALAREQQDKSWTACIRTRPRT